MQYARCKVIVALVVSFLSIPLPLHGAEDKSLEQSLVISGSSTITTSKDTSLFNLLPYELKRQLISLAALGKCNFEKVHALKGHTQGITSVAYSPNGEAVITGSFDHTACLWDVNIGQLLHTLVGHTYPITSVAFSPEGKTVITGSIDDTARLWDVQTGDLLRTLEGHNLWINSVAFSPRGDCVVTRSRDGTARLWDVKTEQLLHYSTRKHKLDYFPSI